MFRHSWTSWVVFDDGIIALLNCFRVQFHAGPISKTMGCGLEPNYGYYLDRLTMFETTFGGASCHRLDLQSKSRSGTHVPATVEHRSALQCLSHEQTERTATHIFCSESSKRLMFQTSADVANCQVAATLRAQQEARQESMGQKADYDTCS